MTQTYAPVFTQAERDLLMSCINIGVANLAGQLSQQGLVAVDEAMGKLAALKALAAKIETSAKTIAVVDGEDDAVSNHG